jgi:hypothetical protein
MAAASALLAVSADGEAMINVFETRIRARHGLWSQPTGQQDLHSIVDQETVSTE